MKIIALVMRGSCVRVTLPAPLRPPLSIRRCRSCHWRVMSPAAVWARRGALLAAAGLVPPRSKGVGGP